MIASPYKTFIVDDEQLAIERLMRLLACSPDFEVVGSSIDPNEALTVLSKSEVDLLFLDIQMPGMSGFDLLAALPIEPVVVFTTAYDKYALKAFESNSIDYLLKPIEPEHLERALGKLRKFGSVKRAGRLSHLELKEVIAELGAHLSPPKSQPVKRVAARLGSRISFIDVEAISHFLSHDKLTFAVTNNGRHCIDETLAELEKKLDADVFVRVHRRALVNLNWVKEVNTWFGGKVVISLKDPTATTITVARDRVRQLRERLGF